MSTGKPDGFVDLIASKTLVAGIEIAGFGGVALRGDPATVEIADSVRWGVGAAVPSRARLRLVAELTGEVYFDDEVRATENAVGADGSVAPLVTPLRNPVDGTLGLTWQTSTGLFIGAGVSWALRRDSRTEPLDRVGFQFRLGWHPGTSPRPARRPPTAILPTQILPPIQPPLGPPLSQPPTRPLIPPTLIPPPIQPPLGPPLAPPLAQPPTQPLTPEPPPIQPTQPLPIQPTPPIQPTQPTPIQPTTPQPPPIQPPLGPPLIQPPPPPEQVGWLMWLALLLALVAVLVATRLAWRALAVGPLGDKTPPRFVPRPSTRAQQTIVPLVASPGYLPDFVSRRYALGLRPRTVAGVTIVPDVVLPRYALGLRSRPAPGVHTIAESVSHETTQGRRTDD